MRPSLTFRGTRNNLPVIACVALLLTSVVLLLGGCKGKTPTATATQTSIPPTLAPTSTPQALPPALVETDPLPGEQIALKNPITLYFNQPMQKDSVEAAISMEPKQAGSFTWKDDSSVTFTPQAALQPGAHVTVNIATTAKSSRGLALQQPISLSYATTDYLKLLQGLPDKPLVDPTSAVVAAFNQPVVSLGADPANLPAGFTISPPANGRGEWLNTSTYIFYPEPSLAGGTSYTVDLNPRLTSLSGAPLEANPGWSFSTGMPSVIYEYPTYQDVIPLDTYFQLKFSYSMDAASVESYFYVQADDGTLVNGETGWDENFTTFTFTPTVLLERDTTYTGTLSANAAALGGTRLGTETKLTWHTVSDLVITGTDPAEYGEKTTYQSLRVFLTSLVDTKNIKDYVTFDPPVPQIDAWMDDYDMALSFWVYLDPATNYTVTISPELTDLWGSKLGEQYTFHFRTADLDPAIQFTYSTDTSFLTTHDPGLPAQVTNLSAIPLTFGTMTINDLVQMYGDNGYTFRQVFNPRQADTWTFYPEVPPNRSTTVTIPISPDGQPRSPGLYFMRLDVSDQWGYINSVVLAVSHYQTILKLSPTEAFVWVVDLDTNAPAAGIPLTVYDQSGSVLTSGNTGSDGVFQAPITGLDDPYNASFVILGTPGEDNFGFASAYWSQGITPWDFDVTTSYRPQEIESYLYTDRPIYRPGDTVNFHLIVRKVFNGRYSLPDISSYPVEIRGLMGDMIASFDIPLSGFATGHGEYALPADIPPGDYAIHSPEYDIYVHFQVADYRKPEINLQVEFQSTDVLSGTDLVAQVNARYFFDAPAGNMPVKWTLYSRNAYFSLHNYQVGPVNTDWLDFYNFPYGYWGLGDYVTQGEAKTDANGLATISIPAPANPGRQKYILVASLTDESGLPVSGQSTIYVNPAPFYIGVHPDAWSYQSESPAGFDVLVADWNGEPVVEKTLSAKFQSVVWVRHEPSPEEMFYAYPTYVPEYTLISSTSLTTDADGVGRLSFTPTEPGTYQVDVSGDGSLTQVLIWVGGPGQAIWPSLPNQRLHLVTDQDSYKAGDTAKLFVPNPFNTTSLGLLTVERGVVMSYQILQLDAGGSTISLPLTRDDAPNVFVAVTLLGQDENGNPDFRHGYATLNVDPSFEFMNISLTSQPERTGPGEQVTFSLRVTDAGGNPVRGEFSLSVIDLAVLSLADPNSDPITTAFYGSQSLNVRTGISLAGYVMRFLYSPGGMGGGGGGESPAVSVTRENFPDTAYWNAEILTDANGEATVSMYLPDSLTTWQVQVRGVTKDTLVGETTMQVVTTKDLLIRPVTPRFMVVADHAMLAAVVQNNTAQELQGSVSLQATGFILDEADKATQQVTVPPNGKVRLEWWGTAQDVASASLRFSVQAGSLQDAVLVSNGALPILHYNSPQTFATSGTLYEGGERLELVSLPVTFDATNGSLDLELDPSLASAMLDALEVLENYPYDCTEPIISRFLPNLVTYTTLQSFDIDTPDLKDRLDRTLSQSLDKLVTLQNADGGWSWCRETDSDEYVSAYVLLGLATARDAGFSVPEGAIEKARSYISSVVLNNNLQYDQMAFGNYVMTRSGAGIYNSVNGLYTVRDQLSPWGRAMLALSLASYPSTGDKVDTIISDLQATAIRSATGVHWEVGERNWSDMTSTLSNSAMVLYTLAQLKPDSTLIPDAVNYLMSNRLANGCWSSSYETAWILLSMDEVMKSTGELNSSYAYSASLNGNEVASGQAGADNQLTPQTVSLPISSLFPQEPNALLIHRDSGAGQLYYTAALNVYRPVEDVVPLNSGVTVSRAFYQFGVDWETATPLSTASVGTAIIVRLTIVVPTDVYHFVVDDYIPAGSEIVDTNLKSSLVDEYGFAIQPAWHRNPYENGWGWWLFNSPQIHSDHISWTASYLPAGSYNLTYTLNLLQAGEYHLLPARAWMLYFPEVQGTSAGGLMEITP